MSYVGTVSRGIRMPVIKRGENVMEMITDAIVRASQSEDRGFAIGERDVTEPLEEAAVEAICGKGTLDIFGHSMLGTMPRRLTNLRDLTSGSGDKDTPVVYIREYFDNYSDD